MNGNENNLYKFYNYGSVIKKEKNKFEELNTFLKFLVSLYFNLIK